MATHHISHFRTPFRRPLGGSQEADFACGAASNCYRTLDPRAETELWFRPQNRRGVLFLAGHGFDAVRDSGNGTYKEIQVPGPGRDEKFRSQSCGRARRGFAPDHRDAGGRQKVRFSWWHRAGPPRTAWRVARLGPDIGRNPTGRDATGPVQGAEDKRRDEQRQTAKGAAHVEAPAVSGCGTPRTHADRHRRGGVRASQDFLR
jgi:hypothetical protein